MGGFGGAVLLGPAGVARLGVAIERVFLQRLYREDPMLGLLFTFGLAMTIEQSLRLIWGTTGLPFSIPDSLRGTLLVGDFTIRTTASPCWQYRSPRSSAAGCSSTRLHSG